MKNYKATIYACYIGYITQAIINNLAPLLFLTFQREFEIPVEQIGLLISLNFGTQICVDLLAARLADRIGYRATMVVAHVSAVIGLAGLGIFPYVFPSPYVGLVAAMMINAIGGGITEVMVSPIVEAAPSGRDKDKAMSLLHSFYCFGHVGVVLVSTVLFTVLGMGNWRFVPLLWALVPLFNCFLFMKVPINTLVEEGQQTPVRKLLTMKMFWIFVLLMLCSGASEQAMSQWASYFAESSLGVSKAMGDLLGPCAFALLMGGARAYYGNSGEKMDLEKFIFGSAILCICSYLLAIFSLIPLLGLLGCALCGLSVGIMWPGTFSIAAKECPQGGITMFAFLALAGDGGCMSGPGVVSVVSGIFPKMGLKAGLLVAMIFPVGLAAVMGMRLVRRRKG